MNNINQSIGQLTNTIGFKDWQKCLRATEKTKSNFFKMLILEVCIL